MERGVNCDHATLYRGEAPGIRYTRPIADSADSPGCIHHVHIAAARGEREPTFICSCTAGLIHMHDCPVLAGLECVHFSAGEEPEQLLDTRAADRLHTELMEDFLSRRYYHRIRSLSPASNPYESRRDDLLRQYAEQWEDEGSDDLTPEAEERYVEERDVLIERRRKRDEERMEREQKTREERAKERAKMGIKTVVERARESVAARGNVSESMVDKVELPADEEQQKPRRKRRRRRRGASSPEAGGGGAPQAPPQSGEGPAPAGGPAGGDGPAKPRRRRRRRRRKSSGEGPSGGKPSE